MIKSIIFVCLGNICRSPLAKGVAIKLSNELGQDLMIDSAGTSAYHIGEAPCKSSIELAAREGIDISGYRAKQFEKSHQDAFDLVVAMDNNNLTTLQRFGVPPQKLLLLGDFGFSGADVPDTYYIDDKGKLKDIYGIINSAIINLFTKYSLK